MRAFALCLSLALCPLPAFAQRPLGPRELPGLVTRLDPRAVARLTELLANDALTAEQVAPHAAAIEAAYARLQPRLVAHPFVATHTCGTRAIPRAVTTLAAQADVLLDLLGFVDTPASEPSLRTALALPDPGLRLTAATALHRRHLAIDDAVLASIAGDDTVRTTFLDAFADSTARVPPELHTVNARARSDLVQWFAFTMHEACVPAEITVEGRYVMPDTGLFLIFRVHRTPPRDANDHGVAAVAGPYDPHTQGPAEGITTVVVVDDEPWGDESAMEQGQRLVARFAR